MLTFPSTTTARKPNSRIADEMTIFKIPDYQPAFSKITTAMSDVGQ